MGNSHIFKHYAPLYRAAGFNPIPVKMKDKKPMNTEWNYHKDSIPSEAEVLALTKNFAACNIGIALGTTLLNDHVLAAIDIDTPAFVPFVKAILGNVVSAKIGSKGITYFCQATKGLKSIKLKAKGKSSYAAEVLIDSTMTVVPPSIHPKGFSYRWEGTPLLETAIETLPVLDEKKYEILKIVLKNEHAWTIATGGADVQGHDPMLRLAASGIASLAEDLEWLAESLNALFHPDYSGNTKEETLGCLISANDKGLGQRLHKVYSPGDVGPIPMGYLEDGRYVFFDQVRQLIVHESSNRLLAEGTLLNLAPRSFWLAEFPFPRKNDIVVNTVFAGDTLMQHCRQKGGFDVSKIRGRGVYLGKNGEIVANWGDHPARDGDYIYVCHLPLPKPDASSSSVEAQQILDFLGFFNWSHPSEAYLALGWLSLAVICGALEWRPHAFINGSKNSGKTTIITTMGALLEPMAIVFDGQSTEAGIRQTLGADSRPILIDEFESDQSVSRMNSIIKLARSASSAQYTVARGTPEGHALQFCIRATFLFGAINPRLVSAADSSRIVLLNLNRHQNNKEVARKIAEASRSFRGSGPKWCQSVIQQGPLILRAIETLKMWFPPCESRHALNMSSLMAGAWVMLNKREMTDEDAQSLLEEHTEIIQKLAEAHDEDDAIQCLDHLLSYILDKESIGSLLSYIMKAPQGDMRQAVDHTLALYGIKWLDDGFLVSNTHPCLEEVFKGTIWAGKTWGAALSRLPSAVKEKQKRFSNIVTRAVWLPKTFLDTKAELLRLPLQDII